MADGVERGGGWRRGEQVLWTDVAVPLQAILVWIGLAVVTFAMALPALTRAGFAMPSMPGLLRQPVLAQAITATLDLVIAFFLWRVARRVADAAMIARFRPVRRFVVVLAGVGGALFAIATMMALVWLYTHRAFVPHDVPSERMFVRGPLYQYAVVLVTVAVVAPFVEEFYFRGILLSWLGRKIGIVAAAVASALIFALLHLRFVARPGLEGWMLTGLIAMVGLVNAVLALRTRSLWPPIAFHAGYNGMLTAVALVQLAMLS
jgi:membrane protease YdiL (CAAX protease family)